MWTPGIEPGSTTWQYKVITITPACACFFKVRILGYLNIRAKSLDLNGKDGGWNIFKISWNFSWKKVLEAAKGRGTSLKRNGLSDGALKPYHCQNPLFSMGFEKIVLFWSLCSKKLPFCENSYENFFFRINYTHVPIKRLFLLNVLFINFQKVPIKPTVH